jgi:hypothetical protein
MEKRKAGRRESGNKTRIEDGKGGRWFFPSSIRHLLSSPFLTGEDLAPGVGGDDLAHKLGSAGGGNGSAPVFQFGFFDILNQITLADGRPVQAIR